MALSAAEARARIAAHADLNAFIALTREEGTGPIVAVKDVIDVAGMPTTCGAASGAAATARDAAVVSRLRAAGAWVIGKTNLQAWAFGVTSENLHWGDVGHPRDARHVPGGSSGGSAVAVATGMCDWALGTDTGGSVRLPAALCGVVGFKPSHGAIATDGVVPLAPSLDTVGLFALDVAGVTQAFRACTGQAAHPGSAARARVDGPLRLAVPAGWVGDLDPAVAAVWVRIARGLPEVAVPDRTALARCAMTVMLAEAAQVHGEMLAAHPEVFAPGMRAALQRGLQTSPEQLAQAQAFRREAQAAMAQAMHGLDALLTPAVGMTAPRRDSAPRDKELTRYTLPINATGQPAISLPARVDGWPVGLQLAGRAGEDEALLGVAAQFARLLAMR